jgi:hypothetical protein
MRERRLRERSMTRHHWYLEKVKDRTRIIIQNV